MTEKKRSPRKPYPRRADKPVPVMPPPNASIEEVAKIAQAADLSYGKYMMLVMAAEAAARRKKRGLR